MKALIVLLVVFSTSFIQAQDTIREVYATKHLYLPFSLGYSKQMNLGTLYNGAVRSYIEKNPASISFKTARISFEYNVFRRNQHAVALGLNFDSYQYRVLDMIDSVNYTVVIGGESEYNLQVPLKNKMDLYVGGIRFSPYIEYNYAFKQDKRQKQSVGLQLNYGFFGENTFVTNSVYVTDLNVSYPRYFGQFQPEFAQTNSGGNAVISSDSLNVPSFLGYSGVGIQLHYDFLYVHTNFDDLRIRAYYSMWFPKSDNSLRFVNGIGIGLFLHLGRHFPKLDKF
ncbi:MAG: hypothetical protein KJ941_08545 [Bacteroidetes bacterium]|nr:hypothetical protein [Bacteroidota bacterium]